MVVAANCTHYNDADATGWLNMVPLVLKDVDKVFYFSAVIRGIQTRFFAFGSCL